MAITEISVSKIYILATEPTNKVKDRFWFDTTNNLLKRYDGTSWKPISVSSDDVVVLSSGNKVSLTNYLNTQIAALAEGIDSKQDKLKFYTEVSGDTPSATISVENIKLVGSVAEGYNTKASSYHSHAEGYRTTASGHYSHAEGYRTTASGDQSHAEGDNTTASGNYTHAEGGNTTASGYLSHAEGGSTTASGDYSHVEGYKTTASSYYQHAQGKHNIEDANEKYADIIGNGTSPSARSNAATVSWDGISWSQTDVRAGGTDQDNATYSLAALAEGIDSKQDKLKFYSEVDKSDDASVDSTGSEINLNTSSSQYGGSNINITAQNGQYKPGNINLKAKSYNTSNGGTITLESEGGSASGGNITLHSKVNSGGDSEPGGKINLIADGSNNSDTKSNIKLQANNIQLIGDDNLLSSISINDGSLTLSADNTINLNGNLDGSGIDKNFDYTTSTCTEYKLPTTKFVSDLIEYEIDKVGNGVYAALNTKQNKLAYYTENRSSPSANISINNSNINVYENEITLNAGDSADPSNIGLKLNSSSIILNSTSGLTGEITNLLTIKTNSKGPISSLSGDLISKSITSSSTDTQLPTSKAVKTELDKKQNSTDNNLKTSSKTVSGAINELNTKLSSDVVHLSGNETITGEKTFSSIEATNGITISDWNNDIAKLSGITIQNAIAGTLVGISFANTVASDFIPIEVDGVDYLGTNYAKKDALDDKQNKLKYYAEIDGDTGAGEVTIGSHTFTANNNYFYIKGNIVDIDNNELRIDSEVSGSAISTSIPTLSSASEYKLASEKAVATALDTKQDNLSYYHESASTDQTASIQGAKSFAILNTSDGLIINNNNSGIIFENNRINESRGIISIINNSWKNNSDPILFDIDDEVIKISDALLIPEIKNKQNSTDAALNTTDKTIVGAINELNTQINTEIPEPITSVYTISSDSLASIISNTTYAGVSGQILISADVENTGPILIGESITDKTNAFPIYPDQIFPIPFSDINNFKVAGNIGNKFNYIISFRSLNNTSPAVNGGITILNENGYYKLTPEGDGETATLTITKLK